MLRSDACGVGPEHLWVAKSLCQHFQCIDNCCYIEWANRLFRRLYLLLYTSFMKDKSFLLNLLYSAILFTSGCAPDNSKSINLIKGKTILVLPSKNTFDLKHYSQLQYWHNSTIQLEHIYLFNERHNQITHYTKTKNKLTATQHDLKYLFPKSQTIPEGFQVINRDSILFMSGDNNEFCLTDANLRPVHRWSLKAKTLTFDALLHTSLQPLGYWRKQIYSLVSPDLGATVHDKSKFNQAYSVPNGAITYLGDSLRLLNAQGHFPGFLSAEHSYNTYGAEFCVSTTGTAVYSFGAFAELYAYHADGSREQKVARSRYHQPPQEFPFDKYTDYRYLREYKLRNSEYGHIFYDPYRHVYLRVYEHGAVGRPGAKSIDDFSQKPWSLMILNDDLEVVNEIKFPSAYNPKSILITRRGVLISPTRPGLASYNPKQIPFQLFLYKSS